MNKKLQKRIFPLIAILLLTPWSVVYGFENAEAGQETIQVTVAEASIAPSATVFGKAVSSFTPGDLFYIDSRSSDPDLLVTLQITNIDELKQLNEELEQRVQQRTAELAIARDQAESANRAKSDFVTNIIPIVTNEPIKAEVIVEKEIEYRDVVKEVTVEKFIEQREFSSKKELEKWLAEDDTNETIYYFTDKNGVARTSDQYDCDDYALQLQKRASEAGFLMSVTIIQPPSGPHMINLVTTGNDIYYIEPQTDEVTFYSNLD